MSGHDILIVEDDMEFLRMLTTAFVTAGFRVRAACDGEAGLKTFAAATPDLVITDIIMPGREGIETILAMKAAQPQVRIIAISGGGRFGPAEFLKLARHLGADEVLAKPLRPSDLIAAVRRLLQAPLAVAG